jgi:hypothetical protein
MHIKQSCEAQIQPKRPIETSITQSDRWLRATIWIVMFLHKLQHGLVLGNANVKVSVQ